MAMDSWMPVGYSTPDGERVHLALYEGQDWQIYKSYSGSRILIAKEKLINRWLISGLVDENQFQAFQFGDDNYFEYSSNKNYVLCPVEHCKSPENKNEALSFASSLKGTRTIDKESSLHDAIYVERLSRLLPTFSLSSGIKDDVVFGAWLTGGVPVSVEAFRRLRSLMSWMGTSHLQDVVVSGGFHVSDNVTGVKHSRQKDLIKKQDESASRKTDDEINLKRFTLAGRPDLEQFINEHVIDIIENEASYKNFGIEFPSAIILHGPPGCGKTFAAECLVDYLEWPCFQIEASSVASPYIHETSKKIAEVFDKAIKNSPSVLVIDEMEAFLADRQYGGGSSHHRVEEVAEFLRIIPEAIQNHVLILAMTNRIDMIDPAILRRGRFDHVVKVDMASEDEVHALLEKLIAELPCDDDVDIKFLAKNLAGQPLSNVTFTIREGARLAARSGSCTLNQKSLLAALGSMPARDGENGSSRKIGFL